MSPGRIILWSAVGIVGITFVARHVKPVGSVWPVK